MGLSRLNNGKIIIKEKHSNLWWRSPFPENCWGTAAEHLSSNFCSLSDPGRTEGAQASPPSPPPWTTGSLFVVFGQGRKLLFWTEFSAHILVQTRKDAQQFWWTFSERRPPKSGDIYQWMRAVLVLTEVNEHLSVALPHVLRHGEDAGHVVVQERVLLLWKERKLLWQNRTWPLGSYPVLTGYELTMTGLIRPLGSSSMLLIFIKIPK